MHCKTYEIWRDNCKMTDRRTKELTDWLSTELCQKENQWSSYIFIRMLSTRRQGGNNCSCWKAVRSIRERNDYTINSLNWCDCERLTDWRSNELGWLNDWVTGQSTTTLADQLTDRLTNWLTGWLASRLFLRLAAGWLTDWLTACLTDWLTV